MGFWRFVVQRSNRDANLPFERALFSCAIAIGWNPILDYLHRGEINIKLMKLQHKTNAKECPASVATHVLETSLCNRFRGSHQQPVISRCFTESSERVISGAPGFANKAGVGLYRAGFYDSTRGPSFPVVSGQELSGDKISRVVWTSAGAWTDGRSDKLHGILLYVTGVPVTSRREALAVNF
ncbi:uncharacterized protein CIMG_13021 [Coccidioides immitis RS]|uniref:Uncharacterized protein n=1 Tax=Coccidioides immitis (strain RS) TaxID=246410 RepID=A0A0D8JW55_COCIM|nr:uncharacterized protein CIMG_13021 [Coccidioides immitis RS]KJF60518.1 hypothetical protein CIMG_13021 [Coccidioides immitis RS]